MEEVGQDLGGVELVGQAVPDRHTGVVGEVFHDLLAVATVFDAVEHPAQHPGSVGDGLFLADLAARRVEVGDFHAQIVGCNFEAAAGAGGGLLKDEGDVLAAQSVVADTGLFLGLQVGGEVQQALDLVGGVIKELQKAAVRKIHCIYSSLCRKNRIIILSQALL